MRNNPPRLPQRTPNLRPFSPPEPAGVHRFRLRFSRGEELKYISHLDVIRLWERALRRARVPLQYSEGFSPHPRISIAAPMALGITSEGEMMDIHLERRLTPSLLMRAIPAQLPAGIGLLEVQSISGAAPSLQSQVRFAEYQVRIATEMGEDAVHIRLDEFLSRDSVPWQHIRDTGPRRYDLRPLVDDLWLVSCQPGNCLLGFKLRLDTAGAGRPEQVAAALGFPVRPLWIHRKRLFLADRRQ